MPTRQETIGHCPVCGIRTALNPGLTVPAHRIKDTYMPCPGAGRVAVGIEK